MVYKIRYKAAAPIVKVLYKKMQIKLELIIICLFKALTVLKN